MKILWVEDFDGGSYKEYKDDILEYYGIEQKDIIIKGKFSEALAYMNENPTPFDLVILDINIKRNLSENPQELYHQYFKNSVSESFYKNQFESEDVGILLFLYLRDVKNFPKEKIAFLSAFVSADEEESESDGDYYKNKFFDDEVEAPVIKEEVKKVSFNTPDTILKQFEEIGIKLHHKYRKPPSVIVSQKEIDLRERSRKNFLTNFINPNETDYVIFRRSIIEMADILMDTYEEMEIPDIESNLAPIDSFVKIRNCFDKEGKEIKTFFNQTKESRLIGKGTDIYPADYFFTLLEKTRDLPLVPEAGEEKALLSYLKELFFCADCFKIPQATDKTDKSPPFDLAGANIIAKARNSLSHGNARNNHAFEQNLLEIKHFLVPLFFRIVFNIDMISESRRKNYLQIEKKLILQNTEIPFVEISEIYQATLKKFYSLLEGIYNNPQTGTVSLEKQFDMPLRTEGTKSSFVEFFLTRLLPARLSFNQVTKSGEIVLNMRLENNPMDFSKDSMEMLYIQYAYDCGFRSTESERLVRDES